MMGGMPGMGPMGGGYGGPGFGGPNDPEAQKLAEMDRNLEVESHRLAEQIRRLRSHKESRAAEGGGDRNFGDSFNELKKKLADVVEKHFQVRQDKRKLELERLERQIAGLRESVKNRDAKKASLIERRLAELIGAEDTGF